MGQDFKFDLETYKVLGEVGYLAAWQANKEKEAQIIFDGMHAVHPSDQAALLGLAFNLANHGHFREAELLLERRMPNDGGNNMDVKCYMLITHFMAGHIQQCKNISQTLSKEALTQEQRTCVDTIYDAVMKAK